MILPVAFLLGAILGWVRATKRDGNRLDKLQYAGAHGIALALLALIVTMTVQWSGVI